jgi:hypothetical protein
MVFGKELRLPCDLLLVAAPDKEQSTIGYVADFMEGCMIFTTPHVSI